MASGEILVALDAGFIVERKSRATWRGSGENGQGDRIYVRV
jgi:hypothetical protein